MSLRLSLVRRPLLTFTLVAHAHTMSPANKLDKVLPTPPFSLLLMNRESDVNNWY